MCTNLRKRMEPFWKRPARNSSGQFFSAKYFIFTIYGKIGLITFLERAHALAYRSKWEPKALNGGDEGMLPHK